MSSGAGSIRRGRGRALAELERSFQGPLEGLNIAPEFFQRLQSPELSGTPLGQGLQIQTALLGSVLGSLTGQGGGAAGQLPSDLASSISENLAGAAGARGTSGSPANLLNAANAFSGASESIRQSRVSSALQALQSVAGGSILPSADRFLQVGLARAQQAASIQFDSGLQLAQARQAQNQAIGSVIGTVGSGLIGGFASPGNFLGGFGVGSGLLPSTFGQFGQFGQQQQATPQSVGQGPLQNFNFGPGGPLSQFPSAQPFGQSNQFQSFFNLF